MQEILNPWIAMEGYNCYGCCPSNPIGAHMRFYEEDAADVNGSIVCAWMPTQDHQSWINTLHGGMQATLLDEVCGWVVFKKLCTSGVTAKMDLKYKQAVSTINGPLLLRARLNSERHRVAVVEGELWMPKNKESIAKLTSWDVLADTCTLCTTCECTYFSFPADKAREMGFVEASLAEEQFTLQDIVRRAMQSASIRYRKL